MALRRADVQPLALVGSYAYGRPLDPGTAWVLSDGRQIVHDPRGLLAGARAAAGTAG